MSNGKQEIISILDAPNISLSENEYPGTALLNFYRALGWNSENEFLNPSKVRTTKAVFDKLYDFIYEACTDPISVGMFMVSSGPRVDEEIPEGKVYLLKGWVSPDESSKSPAE